MKHRLPCMYERSMLRRGYIGCSFSNIFHISHVTILMVSMVRYHLCASIRQLHAVLTLDNTILVLSLCLGKVSAILVSPTILIGKGLRSLIMVGGRGGIGQVSCKSRSNADEKSKYLLRK